MADKVDTSRMVYREIALDRSSVERMAEAEDSRTVELAFASEAPVERWFGLEILDCSPDAVDLSRLNNSAALLKDHDWMNQTGVVVPGSARADADRFCRASARFSRNPAGEQEYRDVLDGIRTLVSVGYRVNEMVLEKKSDDGPDIYRVTSWTPIEISLVSVPADVTVGVGRSMDGQGNSAWPLPESAEGETRDAITDDPKEGHIMSEQTTPAVDVKAERQAAVDAERHRVNAIRDNAEALNLAGGLDVIGIANEAIRDGSTVEQFVAKARAFAEEKAKAAPKTSATLDIPEKEKRQYSAVRLFRAMANPGNRKLQDEAALEFEVSAAEAKRLGREPQGQFIPTSILDTRTLVAGTAANGGYVVADELQAGSFIDLLANRTITSQMGATMLRGLVGDIQIPRLTAGASGSWVAEGNAASETTHTLDQVTLSPKGVTSWSEVTKQLLHQSTPDIDNLLINDLTRSLSIALDLAGLHGSGSANQPTGIASTSGIGSVAGGTNGAAPTLDHLVKLEEEVAIDNADMGNLGYVTNPKVRRKLKVTPVIASTDSRMVWAGGDMPLNDYRVGISNQVSSTLVKGTSGSVCSAIFFGNWNDLIFGIWGGLDVMVDPYSQSTTQKTRIVASLLADVAVRHPQSFAAMLDALTT